MRPTESSKGKLAIYLTPIIFVCLFVVIVPISIIICPTAFGHPLNKEPDGKTVASSYPSIIIGEDGGNYLILNDDEVLQNTDILRHLAMANKEEVEEIVERSPALQASLLNKVQNAIDLRESRAKQDKKASSGPLMQSSQTQNQNDPLISLQDDDIDELDDNYENDENISGKKKTRFESFKNKFKDKATKVFKIGSGLREKLTSIKQKKKAVVKNGSNVKVNDDNDNNGRLGAIGNDAAKSKNNPSWPHFRYSVSTN